MAFLRKFFKKIREKKEAKQGNEMLKYIRNYNQFIKKHHLSDLIKGLDKDDFFVAEKIIDDLFLEIECSKFKAKFGQGDTTEYSHLFTIIIQNFILIKKLDEISKKLSNLKVK